MKKELLFGIMYFFMHYTKYTFGFFSIQIIFIFIIVAIKFFFFYNLRIGVSGFLCHLQAIEIL